ncbi:MAG: serine/threonine-protein kinase [Pirellulales bacterium]
MARRAECVPEEDLVAHLEERNDGPQRERIASHLSTCAECRHAADWLRTHLLKDTSGDPQPFLTTCDFGREEEPDDLTQSQDTNRDLAQRLLSPSESRESLGRLNDYEVLAVLGRGGYGIVFEAMDKVLNRRVAIKVLNPDLATQAISRRRFIREARAGAAINHPNVVTIFGVEEAGDTPFLVMELLLGKSLRERLRRPPKLDVMDILRISVQIAQGLAAAHAQGIVHRDVKPGNVLLVDEVPRVKITDFGLARVTVENVDFTSRGMAVGTPGYMSPEQVRGEELDSRSDLFALGCVIYAMFTGHSPFHGRNVLEIARRIDGQEPKRLRELDPAIPEFIDEIVHRLLRKNPEERFQSAGEVADVLNRHLALLNQTPTDRLPLALSRELMDRRSTARRPQPLRAVAVGGALLALLIAISFLVQRASWFTSVGSPPVGTASSPSTGATADPGSASTQGSSPVAPGTETHPPADTTPPAPRQPLVTVAQAGQADCRTLTEALDRVAAGGTISVLDDATYNVQLGLSNAEQLAGVRIDAPRKATLRSEKPGPLLSISAVPHLQITGFQLLVPQRDLGIEVTGECPGLRLADITVRRLPNPDGSGTSQAGLALRAGAAGTAEEPILLQRLQLLECNVGVVLGTATSQDPAVRHVVLEESRISGMGRHSSTLLAILRNCEQIQIRRNVIHEGATGVSFVADAQAAPRNCRLEANSWHGVGSWLIWTGPPPVPSAVFCHGNLLVDVLTIGAILRDLPPADPPTFQHNLLVHVAPLGSPTGGVEWAGCAVTRDDFPLQSVDPANPEFLKPDFSRLATLPSPPQPVPGAFSAAIP